MREGGRRREVYLHREILGLEPGDGVDGEHRDGDPLNNRRSNLRVATRAQNHENVRARGGSSRHRGVHWNKRVRRWQAGVQHLGRRIHLGYFDDELAAARAASDWRAEHLPFSTGLRDVAPATTQRSAA